MNQHLYPWAIVFPKTIEETQKIIKLAKKYGLFIKNENIEHLDTSKSEFSSPYIVINQKNMTNFSFDPDNGTVNIGVGLTIKEINHRLMEKGYYLPIHSSQKNLRFFEIINHDNADVVHSPHSSISDFINYMNVVLPNSEALCTNTIIKKTGYGISLNELFIGSNATLGIPIEANLKVLPIPQKVYKIRLFADLKTISASFYDVIKDFQNFATQNGDKLKKCNLKLDNDRISFEIISFSKIIYDSFLEKHHCFQLGEALKIRNDSKKELLKVINENDLKRKEGIFKYQIDKREIFDLLTQTKDIYLKEFMKMYKYAQFSFCFNLLNNNYTLDILKSDNYKFLSEKTEKFKDVNRQILNYVIDRNGLLVSHYDVKNMSELKSLTKLLEFGKNNLHMQKNLKELLDPKNIFINEEYNHKILQ